LVDGSKLKGVVTRDAGGIVTIENSAGRVGVQRNAIVKIVAAARYVVQRAHVTIPINAPADAHYLQFLVSTPRQLATHVLLGFTLPGKHGTAIVFPGRKPDYSTTQEALPKGWVTSQPSPFEVPSLKLGEPREFSEIAADNGSDWAQFRIDLQQVKDYRLRGNPQARLSRIYLTFDPLPGLSTDSGQLARIAVGSVEAIMGSAHSQPPSTFLRQPALTVDGSQVRATAFARYSDGLFVASAPSIELTAGVHSLSSHAMPPWRVDAALLSQGAPKTFATANLTGFSTITPTEFEGRLNSHGGLLVVTEAYDRGWQLAAVPSDFKATGFALLDYVRLRGYAIAKADHYTVNDMLNGWWVPSGPLHLVALFVPQAAVELGVLLSLLFVAGVILALRRWPS